MAIDPIQTSSFPLYYRKYASEAEKKEVENFRDLTPSEIRWETTVKAVILFTVFFLNLIPPIVIMGNYRDLSLCVVLIIFEPLIIAFSTIMAVLTIKCNYEGIKHGYDILCLDYCWRANSDEHITHLFNDSLVTFDFNLKTSSNLASFYRHHLLSFEDYEAIKAKLNRLRKIQMQILILNLQGNNSRISPETRNYIKTLEKQKRLKIAKMEKLWEIERKQLPMFVGHIVD